MLWWLYTAFDFACPISVPEKKKKQAQYGTSVCAPGIMSFFVLKNGAGLHCFTCACTRAFVLQAVSSHHSMAV